MVEYYLENTYFLKPYGKTCYFIAWVDFLCSTFNFFKVDNLFLTILFKILAPSENKVWEKFVIIQGLYLPATEYFCLYY